MFLFDREIVSGDHENSSYLSEKKVSEGLSELAAVVCLCASSVRGGSF